MSQAGLLRSVLRIGVELADRVVEVGLGPAELDAAGALLVLRKPSCNAASVARCSAGRMVERTS